MFNKKECSRCGKKVDSKTNFCPNCGKDLRIKKFNQEDWGMLGKNDYDFPEENFNFPMGIGALFNSLIKNLDKQFKEFEKQPKKGNFPPKIKKGGISINISTSGNFPPKIKIEQFNGKPRKIEKIKSLPAKSFSEHQLEKLANLPRKEPKTEMKRISDKVIYTLDIPEVKSMNDVSIAKLENSIEIKAIGDKFIYKKIIPVNLAVRNYNLEKGKLVIELKGN